RPAPPPRRAPPPPAGTLSFARLAGSSYDPLWAPRTWLDSWAGVGQVAVGMHGQGVRPPIDAVRRSRLARDLLNNRNGALAHERDGHRLESQALARGAAGGVGAVKKTPLDAPELARPDRVN